MYCNRKVVWTLNELNQQLHEIIINKTPLSPGDISAFCTFTNWAIDKTPTEL